jgi:hypothetical protein
LNNKSTKRQEELLAVFLADSSALKMDAVLSSETLANLYQTTYRNIPEDSILHNHDIENLNLAEIRSVNLKQWAGIHTNNPCKDKAIPVTGREGP